MFANWMRWRYHISGGQLGTPRWIYEEPIRRGNYSRWHWWLQQFFECLSAKRFASDKTSRIKCRGWRILMSEWFFTLRWSAQHWTSQNCTKRWVLWEASLASLLPFLAHSRTPVMDTSTPKTFGFEVSMILEDGGTEWSVLGSSEWWITH